MVLQGKLVQDFETESTAMDTDSLLIDSSNGGIRIDTSVLHLHESSELSLTDLYDRNLFSNLSTDAWMRVKRDRREKIEEIVNHMFKEEVLNKENTNESSLSDQLFLSARVDYYSESEAEQVLYERYQNNVGFLMIICILSILYSIFIKKRRNKHEYFDNNSGM